MKEPEEFKPIDIWPLIDSLPKRQFVCLLCIERVRCKHKVSGRKWLSILKCINDRGITTSLSDAYEYLRQLYGKEWVEIEFNYHYATRHYDALQKGLLYDAVVRKYTIVSDELDVLLSKFLSPPDDDDLENDQNGKKCQN